MYKQTRFIATAAIIAALYAALTLAFAPISYGQIQFRVSEILTVLPFFTPAAIPGLFVGCIVGNIFSPIGFIDIAFGSLASLLAALLTRRMPTKWLAPLPPVIFNGIIIGLELKIVNNLPLVPSMLWVAAGEAIVCFIGGIPFALMLDKIKGRLFA